MGNQITKEQLQQAVNESQTIGQTIRKLGFDSRSGGRYPWIKKLIAKYDIDTSHFVGQNWKSDSVIYETHDPFSEGSTKARKVIRDLILRDNLIPYKCAFCGNDGEWLGKKLSLELDHINGISNDHRLENLRFLCPNCHAITDTYCGKNKK